MTPDELVTEIFRIQQERNPDGDPGDLTIEVQDDMPLVMVRQSRMWIEERESFSHHIAFAQGCPGDNIQDALEKYLQEVINGSR